MRKLHRPASPDCLREKAADWTRDFAGGGAFSWRSDACEKEVRRVLAGMTQTHCAFCDGPLGVEGRSTIEHFHPKKGPHGEPTLAYEWTNLFPSCDVCQGSKGTRFDHRLLKPDGEHYQFSIFFRNNYKTGELMPLPVATSEDQERARCSIEIYGLNLAARTKARLKELNHYELRVGAGKKVPVDDFNYRFFLED